MGKKKKELQAQQTTLDTTSTQPIPTGEGECVQCCGEAECLPPTPVSPTLVVDDPKVVLVKKTYQDRGHRIAVHLGTTGSFTGTGQLTCNQAARIGLYDSPIGEKPVADQAIPGAHLSAGITLYIEGVSTSSAADDVRLTLTLTEGGEPLEKAEATDALSCLDLTLDIHKKSGTALTATEKTGDGRVIHVQNSANERQRAKMVLKSTPESYAGTLVLVPTKANVAVYAAETGGAENPSLEFAVGPGITPAPLYVQGKAVSATKQDTGFALKLKTLPGYEADAVKITVVDTKLVVCEPRVDDKTAPVAIADDQKADPGRAIYLQGTQRASTRALVRVLKTPTDAPCDVVLKAAADHVKLWDVEVPNAKEWTDTITAVVHKAEQAVATPKTLASDDFKDPVKGFEVWAEGAKVTPVGTRSAFTLDVTEVDDATDTVAFTVGLAKIEIEIVRSDGQPVSKAVRVGIKEKAKDAAGSPKDCFNAKIEYEVAPGSYLFELTPQDQEAAFKIVRTVPDGSLEAAMVVKEGAATPVKFSLEPPPDYNYFQFIGYEIETGKYMGLDATPDDEDDARKDFLGRCKIMAEAIDVAFPNAEASADTMKVFVAPEFYFRGIQGAYPVTMLHEIIDALRKHVNDPKFKDWLFVYGSAIGLLKLSDNKALPDVTNVTVTPPPPLSAYLLCAVAPLPTHSIVKYNWKTKAQSPCPIFTVTSSAGQMHEVNFSSGPPSIGADESLWLNDGSDFHPITASTLTGSTIGIVRLQGTFSGAAIPEHSELKQGAETGFVLAATVDSVANTCDIFADFPAAVAGTDLKLTDLGQTEIFNVVFVQKGGPGTPMNPDGSCALKDLLIYKEFISSVDFESVDYGQQDFYRKHRHVTKLSGESNRTLPTQGSADVLGENPNVVGQARVDSKGTPTAVITSEKTTSGLGGGSLFTVDGVEFGVDVCLDHAQSRLRKTGEKVHIHLIPSCGMNIIDANIAIKPKGFVFNVDGQGGNSHTKLQRDTAVIGAPAGTSFAGTSRATFFQKDGKIYVYPREQKQW